MSKPGNSAAAEELLVAAGFWLDGFARDRRRLVDAAVAALVVGLDSPALRELAGLYGYEEWNAVDALVLATARELGLPRPSASTAIQLEVDRRCRDVLAARVPARALTVWADAVDGPTRGDGQFPDLRAFVAFEWQYDELDDLVDFPEFADPAAIAEDRTRLDAEVREEARKVCARGEAVRLHEHREGAT